jgi:hypothetical protein
MSDYNYERYEQILGKIVKSWSEVDDEPSYLEIGTNISEISSVKVIFDGFGLAEDYYYNGRTFQLEDDVIMVSGEKWSDPHTELPEDDPDYEHVKEKLDLFEEFRNGDGPCNPDMQSFAVFIHKDSATEGFEFPEHDFTPWGLIHRPAEEVCLYVWWNREDDSIDVLPLEDRLDGDNKMTVEQTMELLEHIASEYGFDDDTDEDEGETIPFPTARPQEGTPKLNPHAAWPFANATPVEPEPTAEEEPELSNEPAEYAPGELIRIEEHNGKKYEIRQPSADFSKSFPGVLDMIEIKDPNEPKQDYLAILGAVVAKRGLPKEVGAKGWITQTNEFWRDDVHMANVEEGLKGWLYVNRDDDGGGEPSYSNVEELIEVCRSMIEDNNDDETSLYVAVVNPDPDGEDIRHVTINNDDADGKSWEHDIVMDEDEFYDIVKKTLIENGELDAEEAEDMDNDDLDISGFFWSYCDSEGDETRYSYGYGVAYMEFDDGFKVGMTTKDGVLFIHHYNGKDVDNNTAFDV